MASALFACCTSYRLGYQRAGAVRVVVARATYKTTAEDGSSMRLTVPRPRELLRRCLLAPSLLAHFVFAKYAMGLPLFRLESWLGKDGISLDRGSTSRWAEDCGATLGAIVGAMAKDAMSAFCLSTDATGVAIQPAPRDDKARNVELAACLGRPTDSGTGRRDRSSSAADG